MPIGSDRLLFSKADVQTARNCGKSESAFGQKRTFKPRLFHDLAFHWHAPGERALRDVPHQNVRSPKFVRINSCRSTKNEIWPPTRALKFMEGKISSTSVVKFCVFTQSATIANSLMLRRVWLLMNRLGHTAPILAYMIRVRLYNRSECP